MRWPSLWNGVVESSPVNLPDNPSIHCSAPLTAALQTPLYAPTAPPRSTHCPDATEEEEDEDLQMALAYSLSEMQAQQQAEDVISGAEGGGGGKGAGQKNKDQKEEPDNSKQSTPSSPEDRLTEQGQARDSESVVVQDKENDTMAANGTNVVKKRRKCRCIVC